MTREDVEARAIVLARTPYRERDLIVRAAVADHGVVALLARGARGSRRRFGGAIDEYASVVLGFRPSTRGLARLSEARRDHAPEPAAHDLAAFAVRAYVAEVVLAVIDEGHATRFPYRLCAWVHEALAWSVEPDERKPRAAWVLARARVIVLHQQGRLPDLEACSLCHEPFAEDEDVSFSTDRGLRCSTCTPHHAGDPAERRDALRWLRELFAGGAWQGGVPPRALSRWLTTMIATMVERPLRSEEAVARFLVPAGARS